MFGRSLEDVAAIEPHLEDIQLKFFDICNGHKETAIVIERSRVQLSVSSVKFISYSFSFHYDAMDHQ